MQSAREQSLRVTAKIKRWPCDCSIVIAPEQSALNQRYFRLAAWRWRSWVRAPFATCLTPSSWGVSSRRLHDENKHTASPDTYTYESADMEHKTLVVVNVMQTIHIAYALYMLIFEIHTYWVSLAYQNNLQCLTFPNLLVKEQKVKWACWSDWLHIVNTQWRI